MASVSFKFAGGVGKGAGSGVHGNSGVHDLDYPVLDKAVGRSAEAKWPEYLKRKADRDRVRREAGVNAVSQSGDTIVPLDQSSAQNREKAMTLYGKALSSPTGPSGGGSDG